MPRKYAFESDPDEEAPLDNLAPDQHAPSSQKRLHKQRLHQQAPLQETEPYYDEPLTTSRRARGPTAHPDSAYSQLSSQRGHSHDRHLAQGAFSGTMVTSGAAAPGAAGPNLVSPVSPPNPPPHREFSGQYHRPNIPASGHLPQPNVTPGADNFSEAAAGGMAGIAYSVAERNARESGLEAMNELQPHPATPPPGYSQETYHGVPQQQSQVPTSRAYAYAGAGAGGQSADRDSRSSLQGLGLAAIPPGNATPGAWTPSRSPHSYASEVYTDDPYQGYSMQNPRLGFVNPNEIEDDGDEGLEYGRTRGARTSMLSLGGYSTRSSRSGIGHGAAAVAPAAAGAATVGAAAAGGAATAALISDANSRGIIGSLASSVAGRSGTNNRVNSGARYNAVHSGPTEYLGSGGGGVRGGGAGTSAYDLGGSKGAEKSEWLAHQSSISKRWKWIIFVALALMAVAGIVCGVVFGVVLKHNSKNSASSSQTASGDTSTNGDLSINSSEIQALLNNKNLHKVFPGIDYTPINTQYPDCLSNPPSQNNLTRDVAVLSQLTNTIRLYGTDCNQTEMTLHAISQLEMQDTIKIWLGVWQDNNDTTNARQLAQMWDVLDKNGADQFKGVIVANEILYREQMTSSELGQLLTEVRTNLTSRNMSLPVATSDLGTTWDSTLAEASDYIMANIHPFFGGVNAKEAANWTWSFWENNLGDLFKTDTSKNIISETGWPSQGGTDCGTGSTATSCPDAAVAGVDELNQFMAGWVCDALTNGTQYFWFEAFDEPWKIAYDSGDENWEDHWGLMDVDRNLKSGIEIPDCGGQTVS